MVFVLWEVDIHTDTTTSNGNVEISHILEREAVRLRPEYEALKQRIRSQAGIHQDETSWKVQKEGQGQWAWVLTGTETDEVVFTFGRSRGKGVAKELTGDSSAIGITDGLPLYQNIFNENHQLCWAHPHRKFRDLAQSKAFSKDIHQHCVAVYQNFKVLYQSLRTALKQPFDISRNKQIRSKLMEQFSTFLQPHERDPSYLARIKKTLLETREQYFTCLLHENIPPDNNKAERMLRPLVIKRKTSFGSKTQKGADIFSILASVFYSTFHTRKSDFWKTLLGVVLKMTNVIDTMIAQCERRRRMSAAQSDFTLAKSHHAVEIFLPARDNFCKDGLLPLYKLHFLWWRKDIVRAIQVGIMRDDDMPSIFCPQADHDIVCVVMDHEDRRHLVSSGNDTKRAQAFADVVPGRHWRIVDFSCLKKFLPKQQVQEYGPVTAIAA